MQTIQWKAQVKTGLASSSKVASVPISTVPYCMSTLSITRSIQPVIIPSTMLVSTAATAAFLSPHLMVWKFMTVGATILVVDLDSLLG